MVNQSMQGYREQVAPDDLGGSSPDVAFTLAFGGDAELVDVAAEQGTSPAGAGAVVAPDLAERAMHSEDLLRRIATEFVNEAPADWQHLDVLLVLTVAGGTALAYFTVADETMVQAQPPTPVIELAHEHRTVSAELTGRPWWRLMVRFTAAAELFVDYDYGDEPIPADDRLPAEAYEADLQAFPRERVPVWLGAYLDQTGRQLRSPEEAAEHAMTEQGRCARTDELPPLPELWARWAVISAAFVAAGSGWGPRMLLATGWFEGSTHGGSTLHVLPGGRAVLSGGTANAAALDAAYNDGRDFPELYGGAPDWVADPVLNVRAQQGLLSFCYWWDGDGWQHSGSPIAAQISDAVPGIWTADTVIDVVSTALPAERGQVAALLSAAESGSVTRELLAKVLGADDRFAAAKAWYQLSLAGVISRDAA
ncbi:hypothetical protein [Nocardia sp. NPDC049149]|uniref:hypothetical protein n=1 Tax=Nocardia sp. NPDC049149 TaxID=3364315 RepID=UPI0037118D18